MKKLVAVFLLSAVALWAQSATINMGSRGKLTLYLPDTWKFEVQDYGDRQMVNIKPKGDVNAEAALTITFPDTDRYNTKDRLKMRAEINAAPYADQSVEGKAIGKPFTLTTGYGFRCDFTDPELVGKAPQKGNFKTMSVGLIHLTADILIEVAISADGFSSAPYNDLLGAIEGMEYTPPKS